MIDSVCQNDTAEESGVGTTELILFPVPSCPCSVAFQRSIKQGEHKKGRVPPVQVQREKEQDRSPKPSGGLAKQLQLPHSLGGGPQFAGQTAKPSRQ